jgi:hypothetical protein
MVSKDQLKVSLAILWCLLFMAQSCTGTSPILPAQTSPTAIATGTSLPTDTPTAVASRTSTPDDVATFRAIETASIETLISTVPPVVLEEKPSPDGKWLAEVIRYDCIAYQHPSYVERIAYEQLKLINLSDGTEQTIEDQLQNCDGIGGGGLKGLHWSPNNRYFYYTDWREGIPESCGNYAVPMIYRFDTLTQENFTIGGGHISPDQLKLAMWQRNDIVIWDLDQGEVGRVESLTRVRFNGEISWSPDSQSIVYLQTEWDCAPDYGKTYLTRLDLSNMSQELLLEHDSPGFGSVRWDTMNQLTLRDGYNNEWVYSISTKELKAPLSVTITPEIASPTPPTNQLNLSQMSVNEWSSTSLDGKWVAVGLFAFPNESSREQLAYVRLIIFSADAKVRWTILDEWREVGLGFHSPAPLQWSRNGRYFYFTYRAIPDGCSVFPYQTDVQQVNLENGNVQDLLPEPAVAVALSPDDSQVAYSYFYGQPEMGLAVKDLTTGEKEETTIDPDKDFNAGNIVWSPDGKSFALTLVINPCTGEYGLSKTVWAESTTILWVDAETLQQKVLIEEDPRLFVTVEWNELNKIVITDGEENSIWHLDVNTGEVTRP